MLSTFCRQRLQRYVKSRLLGIDTPKRQRTLKDDAIPTLCMPQGTTDATDGSSKRTQMTKRRGIKRSIQDMLSGTDGSESSTGKYDDSDRCSVSGKGSVPSCDGELSNESSETDMAIGAYETINEEQQRKIKQL